VTLAAKKAQTHSMESPPVNKLELYVGNLPATCDRATLKGFFPNSSNISIVMKKPHGTVRHAFVQFSTEEGARKAFEKYRSLEIDGVHVSVLYARIRDVDKSDKMNAKDKKKAAKNKNRTATVGSDASASSAQDSPLKGAAPVKAVAGKFPEKSAPKQQQQKANSEAAKKAQGAPQAQSTPLTGKELQKKNQQQAAGSSDEEMSDEDLDDEDLSDEELSGGDLIDDEAEEGEEPIDDGRDRGSDDDDDDEEDESDDE